VESVDLVNLVDHHVYTACRVSFIVEENFMRAIALPAIGTIEKSRLFPSR